MKCHNCGASFEQSGGGAEITCQYCGAVNARPGPPPGAASNPLGDLFADRDGDGVPDIVQNLGGGGGDHSVQVSQVSTSTQVQVSVNGKTYSSLDQVPPEQRELLRSMGLGGGTPDPMADLQHQVRSSVGQLQQQMELEQRRGGTPHRQGGPSTLLVAVVAVALVLGTMVILALTI